MQLLGSWSAIQKDQDVTSICTRNYDFKEDTLTKIDIDGIFMFNLLFLLMVIGKWMSMENRASRLSHGLNATYEGLTFISNKDTFSLLLYPNSLFIQSGFELCLSRYLHIIEDGYKIL